MIVGIYIFQFIIIIKSKIRFISNYLCLSIETVVCVVCYTMPGDVIKLNHFPRYWPFVRGIHRSQVNSPHKGQWRGASIFDLRLNKQLYKKYWGWWFETPYCAYYDVIIMFYYLDRYPVHVWKAAILVFISILFHGCGPEKVERCFMIFRKLIGLVLLTVFFSLTLHSLFRKSKNGKIGNERKEYPNEYKSYSRVENKNKNEILRWQ